MKSGTRVGDPTFSWLTDTALHCDVWTVVTGPVCVFPLVSGDQLNCPLA